MGNRIDVKDAFFFASLIIIPVVLTFKFMFYYSFLSLIVVLLAYYFLPNIKFMRDNVKGTGFFFFTGVSSGFVLGGISFLIGGGKGFLFFIWMVFYFVYGMIHAARVQKFIDIK